MHGLTGAMARPQTSPLLISQSLPPHFERSGWDRELNPLLDVDEESEEEEKEKDVGDDWLLGGYSRSYGAAPTHQHYHYSRVRNSGRHRKMRKRRNLHSTTVASISSLSKVQCPGMLDTRTPTV